MNRWVLAVAILLVGASSVSAEPSQQARAGSTRARTAKQVAAVDDTEAAKNAFPQFCEDWMGKLAAREKRNQGLIHWEEQSDAVAGNYVGYSPQHTCVVKDDSGSVPVGKISYLEVRYEKRGATREEAERSTARPIETTEVTEIFRFSKGEWVY